MIKVVIADDHPAFVLGLRLSLADVFDVVGTAHDGEDLVNRALTARPDAVITDVRMPKLSGIDACRSIVQALDSCAVVMLSTFNDQATIASARDAGARAFVSKEIAVRELISIVDRLVAEPRLNLVPHVSVPSLTRRERDVLTLISQGQSNRDIGRALGIGSETVKDHCANLFSKLDASDRMSAVAAARRIGLVRD